jgi:o-succinylbenzoate---CoA ligase
MPAGPEWMDAVRSVWGAGAAVFPLDPRLSHERAERLLAAALPTAWMDEDGVRRERGGVPVDPDVSFVVPTSGTTGTPKLAELTRSAVEAAVDASASRLGAGAHDTWLCCLPPWHMGGLLVLARGLVLGAPVEVYRRFDVRAFERARTPVFTSVVPTMLVRLVTAGADLGRFRAILVGGAHLERGLAKQTGGRAGVVATYGLTESCGGVVYDGIPLDGVEVRLGPDGEIQLAGPTLFIGYRLDPEATRNAFTADGWLKTRDAGTRSGGRLRVLGRLDERIVTGGEKVWPADVESILRADPGVAEVMVVGRPDPEWGERVVAVVVPADPADPPALDRLRRVVADGFASYAAPRELRLVKRLPRRRGGKVRRGLTRPTGI